MCTTNSTGSPPGEKGEYAADIPILSPSFDTEEGSRPAVLKARRIVIKMGTRILMDPDGKPAFQRLQEVVSLAAEQRRLGKEVILVASGAVAMGRAILGLEAGILSPTTRRVCAAVGQGRLFGFFQDRLGREGIIPAQLLLTEEDFSRRSRYLDLRGTMESFLAQGVIPIVNENDAVAGRPAPPQGTNDEGSFQRPVFTDNDRLAALVASKCKAHLLVFLTDVGGVYDRNPLRYPDANLLDRVHDPRQASAGIEDLPAPTVSRGGMGSKVSAALLASQSGCEVVVASGLRPGVPSRVLGGESEGTYFPSLGSLPARRGWIAFAASAKGVLHLDAGAVRALRESNASLLPVGVERMEGRFFRGDVVELRDPKGGLVGRGLASQDWEEARLGKEAPSQVNGTRRTRALLRRTDIVLEPRNRDADS